MPGRSFTSATGYRYGFGGQEMDNEISGQGNSYTAEFWQYDPRLGRRWNTDQIVKPWESPYATFSNNPVYYNDPLGLDASGPGTRDDGSSDKQGGSDPIYKRGEDPRPTGGGANLPETEVFNKPSLGGRIVNFFKNTWNKFDNFMKTAFPTWAYSDLKGNSPNNEMKGKGSKGDLGGMEYYLKGKNDGGDGPALKSTNSPNVTLEDGSYLPGSGGGARYKGYTGGAKVMKDLRNLFGNKGPAIGNPDAKEIVSQSQSTAESAHGVLGIDAKLLYTSPGSLNPGAVYIAREANGSMSVWTYGDTPNRGLGWSLQQSSIFDINQLLPEYKSLLKK